MDFVIATNWNTFPECFSDRLRVGHIIRLHIIHFKMTFLSMQINPVSHSHVSGNLRLNVFKKTQRLTYLFPKTSLTVGRCVKGYTLLKSSTQLLFSIKRAQGVCCPITFCIVGRVCGFDSSPSAPRALSSAESLQTQQ